MASVGQPPPPGDKTRGLRREQLDHATCSTPGCTEKHDVLYVHPKCHPNTPVVILYFADGTIEVSCKRCQAFIVCIAITQEDVDRLAPQLECKDPACTRPAEEHFLKIKSKRNAGNFAAYHDGIATILCASNKRKMEVLHAREAERGKVIEGPWPTAASIDDQGAP